MDRSWILAKSLEIGKMNRACNFNGCKKAPTKRVLIFERNTATRKKRDLASLYFCTKHYNNDFNHVIGALRKTCEKQIKIGKTVRNM